jgi:hypothetical protein
MVAAIISSLRLKVQQNARFSRAGNRLRQCLPRSHPMSQLRRLDPPSVVHVIAVDVDNASSELQVQQVAIRTVTCTVCTRVHVTSNASTERAELLTQCCQRLDHYGASRER